MGIGQLKQPNSKATLAPTSSRHTNPDRTQGTRPTGSGHSLPFQPLSSAQALSAPPQDRGSGHSSQYQSQPSARAPQDPSVPQRRRSNDLGYNIVAPLGASTIGSTSASAQSSQGYFQVERFQQSNHPLTRNTCAGHGAELARIVQILPNDPYAIARELAKTVKNDPQKLKDLQEDHLQKFQAFASIPADNAHRQQRNEAGKALINGLGNGLTFRDMVQENAGTIDESHEVLSDAFAEVVAKQVLATENGYHQVAANITPNKNRKEMAAHAFNLIHDEGWDGDYKVLLSDANGGVSMIKPDYLEMKLADRMDKSPFQWSEHEKSGLDVYTFDLPDR